MHKAILEAGIVSIIMLCGPAALAQSDGSRYTMAPTEGGFVRLDTVTGAMSLCSKEDGDWSCKPMQNDDQGLQSELEKLKAANAELQSELRRLEKEKSAGDGPDSPLAGPGQNVPELELPTEEQVDQAIDYLESMIRKFRERFEDFGEKTRPGRGPGPHPTPDTDGVPDGTLDPAPAPAPETPNGAPNGAPNGVPKATPNSNPTRGPETQL